MAADEPAERDLIRQSVQGDVAAFEVLFRRLFGVVYRYALTLAGQRGRIIAGVARSSDDSPSNSNHYALKLLEHGCAMFDARGTCRWKGNARGGSM